MLLAVLTQQEELLKAIQKKHMVLMYVDDIMSKQVKELDGADGGGRGFLLSVTAEGAEECVREEGGGALGACDAVGGEEAADRGEEGAAEGGPATAVGGAGAPGDGLRDGRCGKGGRQQRARQVRAALGIGIVIIRRAFMLNHFGHCVYDMFVTPREKVTDYRYSPRLSPSRPARAQTRPQVPRGGCA